MERTDDYLVGQVLNGDSRSFGDLIDKYKARVYYIAYQMTGNHSDADDIAQDTFIRAYRGLDRFKSRSNFYTWLYRILINCCMDVLRRRKKRGELELNEAVDLDGDGGNGKVPVASTTAGNPEREAQRNELRQEVARALESLPPKHRMVLVLREFDGMAHGDIARIMGCSEGTVRSRLHYARLKMQGRLRKFVGEPAVPRGS